MKNEKDRFRALMTLTPFVPVDCNFEKTASVNSGIFDTEKEAGNFADILEKAGVIVSYRVVYQPKGCNPDSWYNCGTVKYLPQDAINVFRLRRLGVVAASR
jgi:hypothetical protein